MFSLELKGNFKLNSVFGSWCSLVPLSSLSSLSSLTLTISIKIPRVLTELIELVVIVASLIPGLIYNQSDYRKIKSER